MQQYLDLVKHVYENGATKTDRTGTGTRSSFGHQIRFDLQKEFPIVKAKFTAFRLVAVELLWLLSGNTNIKYLVDNNCHIWDEWADANGDLGPVYGAQWRGWTTYDVKRSVDSVQHPAGGETKFDATVTIREIDQIRELVNKLKTNPDDRRMIVSAWNVGEIPSMKLPPCHAFFQFYVSEIKRERRVQLMLDKLITANGRPFYEPDEDLVSKEEFDQAMDTAGIPRQQLSCQLYQRSADLFLGVPFNIASYALLTHMLAQTCGLEVGEFVWTGGDCHIYSNHYKQTEEMLARPLIEDKATLWLNPEIKDIDDFKIEDVRLDGYKHGGVIKAPVAV